MARLHSMKYNKKTCLNINVEYYTNLKYYRNVAF